MIACPPRPSFRSRLLGRRTVSRPLPMGEAGFEPAKHSGMAFTAPPVWPLPYSPGALDFRGDDSPSGRPRSISNCEYFGPPRVKPDLESIVPVGMNHRRPSPTWTNRKSQRLGSKYFTTPFQL